MFDDIKSTMLKQTKLMYYIPIRIHVGHLLVSARCLLYAFEHTSTYYLTPRKKGNVLFNITGQNLFIW